MINVIFSVFQYEEPRREHAKKKVREDEEDEDQYKVDLGEKVDHWFELYGKAVEDNTLQDRIESHRIQQQQQQQQHQQQTWFKNQQEGKNKISYVHQLLMEEEKEERMKNQNNRSEVDYTTTTTAISPKTNQQQQHQQQCFPIPIEALKDIVRNVLFSQGISNPSNQVLEDSIQKYLQTQSQQVQE